MTLFYVPLEPYKERYTMQWSAPETGWLERNWRKKGIDYLRVDGLTSQEARPIRVGCVLDAVGRSEFCFSQIMQLLRMAERDQITNKDCIFFDDFWTPGIEMLPYAFHLFGIRPKMYAFLHAQSVDHFDFTYPMRGWMRSFEKGIGTFLDGIFVCCPSLRDEVVFGGIAPGEKVHVTGHPFSSEEVMERMPLWYRGRRDPGNMRNKSGRRNNVVWSSRFDKEKRPEFFLKVADILLQAMPTASFTICTGSPKLRSNDPDVLNLLGSYQEKWPNSIFVKEDLSKEAYYRELCESKIQFNSALQDWVPITLQEASVAGCYPIYPYFRSFPETFLWRQDYMYQDGDFEHAASMLCRILARDDLWTSDQIDKRSWIHKRYDVSWLRMTNIMGLTDEKVKDPYDPKVWL